MIKPVVISDPYPRTLDLIFTKTKLKELKTKYKIIVAPKKTKKIFMKIILARQHLSWVNRI